MQQKQIFLNLKGALQQMNLIGTKTIVNACFNNVLNLHIYFITLIIAMTISVLLIYQFIIPHTFYIYFYLDFLNFFLPA